MVKQVITLCVAFLMLPVILFACSNQKEIYYSSYSTIVVSTAENDSANSTDIHLFADQHLPTFEALLQSSDVQGPVKHSYPNIQYTCHLESISNTSVIKIVVKSNEGDSLQDVCNAITENFCRVVNSTTEFSASLLAKASAVTETPN